MKCNFCSAPMPHKGVVCDYCGRRNSLNLGVITKIEIEDKKSDHHCPVCNILMENINIGISTKALVSRCSECDGVFVSEDILGQLIENQNSGKKSFDHKLVRFIQDNSRHKQESVVQYKKCPICNKVMQRINYKAISSVIVDRCLQHGIWLDGGELKQIFEWKSAGGDLKAMSDKPIRVENKRKPQPIVTNPENEPFFDPIGNFLTKILGGF